MPRHLFLTVIGIVSTLLFLWACTSAPTPELLDIADGGVLSGEPCGPPCFWNITPGVTTKEQTMNILQDMGLLQRCEYFDTTAESGDRGIICSPIAVFILKEDVDIVAGLGFRPTQRITVEDIIEKYGEPNAVQVVGLGLPESNPQTTMTLYYDSWNMSLRLSDQASITYELEPDVQVENIAYSDKRSYERYRQYSSGWHGFGSYAPHAP